jgi:hypothetical protein
MSIKRYIEKGVVFSREDLSSMGKALEETCARLGISSDEAKRRDVAKFIIQLTQEDCNLDAAALRDRAVATQSNPHASSELAAKRWILRDGEAGAL